MRTEGDRRRTSAGWPSWRWQKSRRMGQPAGAGSGYRPPRQLLLRASPGRRDVQARILRRMLILGGRSAMGPALRARDPLVIRACTPVDDAHRSR